MKDVGRTPALGRIAGLRQREEWALGAAPPSVCRGGAGVPPDATSCNSYNSPEEELLTPQFYRVGGPRVVSRASWEQVQQGEAPPPTGRKTYPGGATVHQVPTSRSD